jgi:hypothetical protein
MPRAARLLALPDHALAEVARNLPVHVAVCLARTCRRLRLALPSSLVPAPCAHGAHGVLAWMRAYELTLVVRREDLARILLALAERPAPWARLVFPKLSDVDHEELWSVVRMLRVGATAPTDALLAKIRAFTGCPRYFRRCFEGHERAEWDWEDEEYDQMSRLNKLHRFRESVTDACMAVLGAVHTLDLSRTSVTDAGVAHLANLHTLLLARTDVTDAGVAHLTRLHTLDLSWTSVTDAGVAHLANLHTLLLRRTDVTDAGVAHLTRLHTLDLRGTKVTGAVAHALRGVADLVL